MKPNDKPEWSPLIPCARCGKPLPYAEAVKSGEEPREAEKWWVGFTHSYPCKREERQR